MIFIRKAAHLPTVYSPVCMCGRYTLRSIRRFKFNGARNSDLPFAARYNIAPGQEVLVVADFGSGPEMRSLVWGLIPSWSVDQKGFINARAETLEEKPSFSESFLRRRCLILADGFFEWKRTGRARQPHYFQLVDRSTFAFAGIWDRWGQGQAAVTSCAIITTTANQTVSELHDRMPVILTPECYDVWLNTKANAASLKRLLAPIAASRLSCYPVSSLVNYADKEGADLVERVDFEKGTTPSLF